MMYKEFTGKNEENLTDNFDKLLAFFSNEINNFNPNQSLIKKEFKALINIMRLSKYFNEIIKTDNESEDNYFNFDDIALFIDENDDIVEIESLISKNINPSLKYYDSLHC